MPPRWTIEQVTALSTDPASLKAGQGLAQARKWMTPGVDDRVLWGEIKGSGSSPYQVRVDLKDGANKCSCPSRKFPCKHVLGLLLILAQKPDALLEAERPAWVADWLAARDAKAQAKAKVQAEAGETLRKPPRDADAQAKRRSEREAKISAGVDELEVFLADQLRQGLAAFKISSSTQLERMARSLMDAQASGLSARVRALSPLAVGVGSEWRLLASLGQLQVLIDAWRQRERLSKEQLANIRAAIGISSKKEEFWEQDGVSDLWAVMGKTIHLEDSLQVQRTWLRGVRTSTTALVLSFAPLGGTLDSSLIPGTLLEATLVYHPGLPHRVEVKARGETAPLFQLPGDADLEAAWKRIAPPINTWLLGITAPVVAVNDARWLVHEGRYYLADREGRALPLVSRFHRGLELLALSGGKAVEVFGLVEDRHFLPLSLTAEGYFYDFARAEVA